MEKEYGEDYAKEYDTYGLASAAAVAGGLVLGGIGNCITKRNQKKAEEIINSAHERYIQSFQLFEISREQTRDTITRVVCLKKQIMGNYMKKLLKSYRRLAPQIQMNDSLGLNELKRFALNQEDLMEIENSISVYQSYDIHRLGERAFDVALTMIQDGRMKNLTESVQDVMQAKKTNDNDKIRNSQDNLKIQSIGVISEFTTLAVEFACSGVASAFTSGKYLREVKEIASKYDLQKDIVDINITKMDAINRYASVHLDLLTHFLPLIQEYVTRSVQIIKEKDNIFHFGRIQEDRFSQSEMEILAFTMSLAGAVKTIIDSPIISQNGDVYDGDNTKFTNVQNSIGQYERQCLEMRSL